jgi:hypothetical protein
MAHAPLTLSAPDPVRLQAAEDAWAIIRARGSEGYELQRAIAVLEDAMGSISLEMFDGRSGGEGRAEYNRSRDDPKLRLPGGTGGDQLDLRNAGPGIALAEFAVARLHLRAAWRHVDEWRSSGGMMAQRLWDDCVMHHPAVLALENVGGRLMTVGRRRVSSRLLVRTGGGTGEVVVHPGSPVVPWAGRRSTRMEIGVRLPEAVVIAMAGRTLGDVMDSGLHGEAADAFASCRVARAHVARGGGRFHLELEPTLPLPRGGPLSEIHRETWDDMLAIRRPL